MLKFVEIAQNGAQGDGRRRLHRQRPQGVFEEEEAEEAAESGGPVHPPNIGRGTLILFNSIDGGRLSFFLC